jgi:hypothetical protein
VFWAIVCLGIAMEEWKTALAAGRKDAARPGAANLAVN